MLENVGKRIQELRKQQNMTITALAKKANTSRSLISQIESGYTVPSLQTLEKVVNALGVSLSDFFKQETIENDVHDFVVQADKRKMLYLPDTPNVYYMLSQMAHPNLEFLLTDYPPHSQKDFQEDFYEMFQHEGLECFFVLEGQIDLTVDGKTSNLKPGDSGCFDSRKPHCYINNTDNTARIILFSMKEDQ